MAREIYPDHIVRFWPREDGPPPGLDDDAFTEHDDPDAALERCGLPAAAPAPASALDGHAFDEAV
jgi:hypothetical protein